MIRKYGKDRSCFLFLLALLVLTALPVQAQTEADLRARLGGAIDANERAYFGLFPQVPDFRSATYHENPDRSLTISILRSGKADTTFNVTAGAAQELYLLIGNYERVVAGKQPVRWPLLRPKLVAMPQFRKRCVPGCIFRATGGRIHGTLLAVTDKRLFVWTGEGAYEWQHADSLVRILKASEIEMVTIERKGHTVKLLAYGGLIGASTGAVAGFMAGDDKTGFFRLTAREKAVGMGSALGLLGGVSGAVIGAFLDHDKSIAIHRNESLFRDALPRLRAVSRFPGLWPPELQRMDQAGELSSN